jgi:hypothetical protein
LQDRSTGRTALNRFGVHAQSYVTLLREHLREEEREVLPGIERMLEKNDRRVMEASFEAFDREVGDATREHYLLLANELADHYGIHRSRMEDVSGAAGRRTDPLVSRRGEAAATKNTKIY